MAANTHAQTTVDNQSTAQKPALNTANTPTPSIPTPSTTLNPTWEKEFKAWVTDAQKMEWMQKSPEKMMAYIKWEEQKTASKIVENQELTKKWKELDAANQELRRVATAMQWLASNGQEFVKLAALSADELGKLPFPIRMEVKKWKQEQLDQVVASLDQEITDVKKVVASLDQGITEQWRLISEKWKEYSITLQKLPIKQVAQYFRTSVPEWKKFLEYVVKNDLPPPWFAQKILDEINN